MADCAAPWNQVEVIVVINQSESDSEEVDIQNRKSQADIARWNATSELRVFTIHQILPTRQAGVGLARKIGMDEAVRRFNLIGSDGVIACLDADCTCQSNYLQAIQGHFRSNPKTPGCAIYFEHPLPEPAPGTPAPPIASYELHLRYYTHALGYSGLPCAFQTVGSAMAVRSSAYEKQGGMNKRKAGEDFYFLQKIIKLGGFTRLNTTTVYPSGRTSHRVPFGTGKAMAQYGKNKNVSFCSYDPRTFVDLKQLVSQLPGLYDDSSGIDRAWNTFSRALTAFLGKAAFKEKMEEIKAKTSSRETFDKRFFQWCDGFFAFKFANYARHSHYPGIAITDAASWLLRNACKIEPAGEDVIALLMQYRELDRRSDE